MTHSRILFVARANFAGIFFIAFGEEINRSVGSVFFVCVIMATNFLELATTLKCLGAKWLPEKKLILRPELHQFLGTFTFLVTVYYTNVRRRKWNNCVFFRRKEIARQINQHHRVPISFLW